MGEDPLGLFLVMDYVEGDSLGGLGRAATARGETIPPRIGVRILLDALAGLHAAHELRDEDDRPMHVVHRDFSPQNILVGLDGVAQLADFGIAKAADRGADTTTGIVKGKVRYMSPEHARSETIDRRADVWSAGVVAWEIFAGRRLYPSDEHVATLLKLVSERPPLLGSVVKGMRKEIEEVVAKALEPSVDQRYPTVAAMARNLAAAFASTDSIADHEEVGTYVRRMAGPKLDARRAQVQSRAPRVSRPPPPPAPAPALAPAPTPTASAAPVASCAPEAPTELPTHDPEPEPIELEPTVTGPSPVSTLSSRTQTASAIYALHPSLPAASPGDAGRRRWPLLVGLGLAVTSALGLLVLGRRTRSSWDDTSTTTVAPSVAPPSTPTSGEDPG